MPNLKTGRTVLIALSVNAPAHAEVRFGKNVRLRRHDFSDQHFNAKRRGLIHLYNRELAHSGCRWVRNADGGPTKVCNLKARRAR